MILTTTPTVEGKAIRQYLDCVTGEAILGTNVIRDLFAGIHDFVGGCSAACESVGQGGRIMLMVAVSDIAVKH